MVHRYTQTTLFCMYFSLSSHCLCFSPMSSLSLLFSCFQVLPLFLISSKMVLTRDTPTLVACLERVCVYAFPFEFLFSHLVVQICCAFKYYIAFCTCCFCNWMVWNLLRPFLSIIKFNPFTPRNLLCRAFLQEQPVRLRDWWRERLPWAQGQVLLHLHQVTLPRPHCPWQPPCHITSMWSDWFGFLLRKLLLCRVTLGKPVEQFTAIRIAHAPPGHHSVIGRPSAGGLNYPEYVVYRGEQVGPQGGGYRFSESGHGTDDTYPQKYTS